MIRALLLAARPLLAAFVAASALLATPGCGQKGPLKLPEPAPAKPASFAP